MAKILLVEDNKPNRDMLSRRLQRRGHDVLTAGDGEVALRRVAESRPGLILLDLMMPHMDGFEFAARLHANPEWRSIPVAVMTAKDLTEDDRRRLNGYVAKVVSKSAGSAELLNALRESRLQGSSTSSEPNGAAARD